MNSENEVPIRLLTQEEKAFVKAELLKVNNLLRKWKAIYNKTLKPSKPIKISEIRSMILEGSLEERFPEIASVKKVLLSFRNDYVPFIGGSFEQVILCSFAAASRKIASNRALKVSAELNINAEDIFEDLIQEAYAAICHSIYYFKENPSRELSTYIFDCIRKNVARAARYKYSKLSPMSVRHINGSYKIRELLKQCPNLTVEEISEETSLDQQKVSEILRCMYPVVRSKRVSFNTNKSASYGGIRERDAIEEIQDTRHSIEESENIDTFEFLKRLFDNVDEGILSFTQEEKDVWKAACASNFERGWQSAFAKVYINRSTGKPYSRARIGQIFSSTLEKIRSLKAA